MCWASAGGSSTTNRVLTWVFPTCHLTAPCLQTPSGVFRELVAMCRSGQQPGAAFMPSGGLQQLLAAQQPVQLQLHAPDEMAWQEQQQQ